MNPVKKTGQTKTERIVAAPEAAAQLKNSALNLLSRREHSQKELRDKLRRKSDDEAMLQRLLDDLAASGLQSDERFAGAYARMRAGRGDGPLKISAALSQRGVHAGLIEQSLESGDIDFAALIKDLHRRKYGGEKPRDAKEKARQFRFLHSRGFPNDMIYSLFK